jgi:hypothetical protein
MKCKTHGEVSDVQHRNKQTLERTDAGSSKKATSVVVTLSIPKPCQVRSYDTSVRIMSGVDAWSGDTSRRAAHGWKKLSELSGTGCDTWDDPGHG